jgi:hypothetical protein
VPRRLRVLPPVQRTILTSPVPESPARRRTGRCAITFWER